MVVHIDPDQNYLSVLSLPRDLRVNIPGHGKGKLNTAFAYGGPALAIKTIEQTTGVDINHYLEVGFDAFARHRGLTGRGLRGRRQALLSTTTGTTSPSTCSPGYQLLDGADALDYVRFRHDRNMDFGRMERQQRFMTALREQAMGWDLPFKLPGLISALFRNVTTDLDANEILRLAKWGIGLSGDRIRAITLAEALPTIGGASYVVVTEQQLAKAVSQLLNVADTPGRRPSRPPHPLLPPRPPKRLDLSGITVDVLGASGRAGEAGAAAEWLRSLGIAVGTAGDDSSKAVERSAIEYPSGMLADARRVAEATGVRRVTRDSVDRVTLLIGKDFMLPPQFALPPVSRHHPRRGAVEADGGRGALRRAGPVVSAVRLRLDEEDARQPADLRHQGGRWDQAGLQDAVRAREQRGSGHGDNRDIVAGRSRGQQGSCW